ncbi:MAG: multifunctional CCA addition/repair protein [Pseudomonadota bacterium]
MDIYLVGGAVRDELLGLEVKDRDWMVVGATPEEMLAAGYRQVGRQFPVFLDPENHEEHALARTETKIGPGYSGFEVHADPGVTLEEDLQRRDLTINAMARDEAGQLIDLHGGGDDLQAGRLRHVSDAFVEDPLRILRLARFAARFCPPLVEKTFEPAEDTLALMREMVERDEIEALTKERSWQEIERAFGETAPRRFFEVLDQCGALARLLAPAVDAEVWTERGERALVALEVATHLSDSGEVRFAAFCGVFGGDAAEALARQWGAPKRCIQLAALVGREHLAIQSCMRQPPPEVLELLKRVDAFRKPERLDDLLLAAEAVVRSLPGERERPQPQREYLLNCYTTASQITGKSIMKVRLEGPELAEEIDIHRRAAIHKIKRTYRWSHFNPQV